jgi:hypothetical protein
LASQPLPIFHNDFLALFPGFYYTISFERIDTSIFQITKEGGISYEQHRAKSEYYRRRKCGVFNENYIGFL